MYALHEIRQVHLEVTERCNAACPQCPRRIEGGKINPKLTMAELTLADVERLIPAEFAGQLRKVYLCGNYGDPAAAAETAEIVAYLREHSPTLRIGVHSNGSLRNPAWWSTLAQRIGANGYVRFAIDGLSDTNHIYRRNTKWETITENARAFIAAGGRAEWDFIVFAHNEHQVDEARRLAKELGFSAFYTKHTNRFLKREAMEYASSTPVRNYSGERVAVLERPLSAAYHHVELKRMEQSPGVFQSYDDYLSGLSVNCKAENEKSLYISAEGKYFPCCYLRQMIRNGDSAETREFAQEFPGHTGKVSPCSMAEALGSRLFSAETTRRLKVCSRVCGK